MAPTALIHLKSRALRSHPIRMQLTAHDTDSAPETTGDPESTPVPNPAGSKLAAPAPAKEPESKPVPEPRKPADDGNLGDAGQKALTTEREARKAAEREPERPRPLARQQRRRFKSSRTRRNLSSRRLRPRQSVRRSAS